MIRVAIADDQDLVRDGLALIVGAQPDMTVTVTAADGAQLVERTAAGQADVALVDVRMPVMDGLEATRRLATGGPGRPRVIILTTFDTDDVVLDALDAGAAGFVLKRSGSAELASAIRAVADGDAMLSPSVTRTLIDRVRSQRPDRDADASRVVALTARELEALWLIGEGANNREIAQRMFLSESTVKTHVSNILMKSQSRDRIQAVLLALRLDPGPHGRANP